MSAKTYCMITLYVCANLFANVAVSLYGQAALVWTAFILIPFDLASRDVLHEEWSGKSLWPKMGALILLAAVLTYVTNTNAARIAIASASAFAIAATVDALIYHAMRARKPIVKMNASNAFGAVSDSIVFPLIAFGALDPKLSAGQAALKFLGGAFWAFFLVKLTPLKKPTHPV